MKKIDLHIHTNLSDGEHNISQVIEFAKANDCNKISITDHEIIKDYSIISANENIEIINGIEFNTSVSGLHILGYGIKDIPKVQKCMRFLHEENEHITFELIDKLKKLKYDISKEKIELYLSNIGIYYDYLDKRHVVKYLIHMGYTKDVLDTYKNLIGRGNPLYIPLKKMTSDDIIKLINNSGGVAVLAHPFTLDLSEDDFISKIKELILSGLEGIEIINGKNIGFNMDFYNKVVKNFNLIKTVGSDFHSIKNNNIGIECNEDLYETLKIKIKSK